VWLFKTENSLQKQSVLIAITVRERMIADALLSFCSIAASKSCEADSKFSFSIMVANRLPLSTDALARNLVAHEFLSGAYDRLWLIDGSIVPPADCFDVLDIDADIAVVPYLDQMTMMPHVLNFKDLNDLDAGQAGSRSKNGVCTVTSGGLRCAVIRRRVLEDKKLCVGDDYVTPDGRECKISDEKPFIRPIFRECRKPNGIPMLSTDDDFCMRATKRGWTVKMRRGSQADEIISMSLQDTRMLVENAFRIDRFKEYPYNRGKPKPSVYA
jgi:hypothetical protein